MLPSPDLTLVRRPATVIPVNPKLNARFNGAKRWRDEGLKLREVLLDCGLCEEFKWGKPCYTDEGANIVIIQRMREFLALMFFKGALLKDPKGVLKQQGPNTHGALRMQFQSVAEVEKLKATIKRYVREAIKAERAGLSVPKSPPKPNVDELAARLAKDKALKTAFEALTPGRQREYNIYFSGAKQAKTRAARVERYAPKILDGKGFRD